jgi:hypothetical protein
VMGRVDALLEREDGENDDQAQHDGSAHQRGPTRIRPPTADRRIRRSVDVVSTARTRSLLQSDIARSCAGFLVALRDGVSFHQMVNRNTIYNAARSFRRCAERCALDTRPVPGTLGLTLIQVEPVQGRGAQPTRSHVCPGGDDHLAHPEAVSGRSALEEAPGAGEGRKVADD